MQAAEEMYKDPAFRNFPKDSSVMKFNGQLPKFTALENWNPYKMDYDVITPTKKTAKNANSVYFLTLAKQ